MFNFFGILGALPGLFVLAQSTQKNWMVNFKAGVDVTDENMDAVSNWIVANKGTVVDKFKSSDYTVIFAQMEDNIHDIAKDETLGKLIDSIDEDDEYDHDDL